MKTQKLISIFLVVLLFGCASTEAILSEFDEAVDFENYSTFVICVDDLYVENTQFPQYDNNEVRALIGDEVEKQMISRDHETNVLEPELQAGFEIIVEEKEATFHNCEVDSEYDYWKECTIDTIIYKEETIVLYVLDFEKNQIIWQASMECDLNRGKAKLPGYVAELVDKMFNEYPKSPNSTL